MEKSSCDIFQAYWNSKRKVRASFKGLAKIYFYLGNKKNTTYSKEIGGRFEVESLYLNKDDNLLSVVFETGYQLEQRIDFEDVLNFVDRMRKYNGIKVKLFANHKLKRTIYIFKTTKVSFSKCDHLKLSLWSKKEPLPPTCIKGSEYYYQ